MAAKDFNLERFISAQNQYNTYQTALRELLDGEKRSHWIWFILPQVKGLGISSHSQYYGLDGVEEAKAYLENTELSTRLRRVCEILIQWAGKGKSMEDLLGHLDAMKAKSCITLFDLASPDEFFGRTLEECFGGEKDIRTIQLCNQQ